MICAISKILLGFITATVTSSLGCDFSTHIRRATFSLCLIKSQLINKKNCDFWLILTWQVWFKNQFSENWKCPLLQEHHLFLVQYTGWISSQLTTRMHSSRMHHPHVTVRAISLRETPQDRGLCKTGTPWTEIPLDRDHPQWTEIPLDRDPLGQRPP